MFPVPRRIQGEYCSPLSAHGESRSSRRVSPNQASKTPALIKCGGTEAWGVAQSPVACLTAKYIIRTCWRLSTGHSGKKRKFSVPRRLVLEIESNER